MTIWVDAQISPEMAGWINENFGLMAVAVRDVGLRDAEDLEIFNAATSSDATVITKDRDFVLLLNRLGPPPKVVWLRCGNTSNARLKDILLLTLTDAVELLDAGESLVEINSPN